MNTEFYLIIAATLFNFLIFVSINERMKNINFRHKFMEENVNQMYNQLLDEIKERYKSQKVYEDYILLFQLYCNEDWDRNNPFRRGDRLPNTSLFFNRTSIYKYSSIGNIR